jgi:5,10-methylenetetrahydromethanopterin reductase
MLGLGAGVSGFEELGLERPKPARALREAIQLIRALLRGETVTLDGEVIHFRSGKLDFTPCRADVPIFVASNNRLGLQAAGALADGAIMQGSVSEPIVRFFTQQVATGASSMQRPSGSVELVARVNVAIDANRAAARNAMRPGIVVSLIAQQPRFWSFEQAGLDVPEHIRERVAGLTYTHDASVIAPIAPLIPDEWVDALTVAGEPDDVASQLDRIVAHGIDHVMVYPVPTSGTAVDVVRTFAREAMPRLAALQR